jgi:molybdenum cofactor synthesis domain-containing protein
MSEMVPFKFLISSEEALKIVLNSVKPIERKEEIPIEESSDRILAENIISYRDVPPFDRAAMDGYAVKAVDTYMASEHNPKILKLKAKLHAGEFIDQPINNGQCVRIATGCPIPSGTDAVVMVEYTEEKENVVTMFKAVHPGANVSPKGEDIKEGELILHKKEQLTSAKVGVLAALGQKDVKVYQKPRIAIVPTGIEVCEVGTKLKKGQIYDVNSYTLASILQDNGALIERSAIIPDSTIELKKIIRRYQNCDLIIFSGGSSVGERDLLAKVIKEKGEILFHGIQIKPGKPTLLGLIEGKPIFGMPGNPTSCLSNAYLFLIPALRKMGRLPKKKLRVVKMKLGKRVFSASGREQFLPVKLIDNKAFPVFKKSGAITSLSNADGYIILPINLDLIEENEQVNVILF